MHNKRTKLNHPYLGLKNKEDLKLTKGKKQRKFAKIRKI